MIKTRTWIIIFAAVLALLIGVSLFLYLRPAPGTVACIYQDGVLVRSIDLSKITQPEEFTISCDGGENTVRAENMRISVIEADCPDKVCVNSGWLSDSAGSIVCLPHRLVIKLESGGNSGIDAVTQ
jgi:hypothetical protein